MERVRNGQVARYAQIVEQFGIVLPTWQIETVCFTVGIRGTIPQEDIETNPRRFGVPDETMGKFLSDTAAVTFKVMHDISDVRAHCLEAMNAQRELAECGSGGTPIKSGIEPRNRIAPLPR